MTIKLIGAGYGRTGTDSTKEALNILGLPCYHMREVIGNSNNKHHLDFWCKVADSKEGTQHDWPLIFKNYQATIDNPAACVWRELIDAYPDAKVLLTLHPKGADAWYDSVMETIFFTELLWQWKVLEFASPFARKFGPMARKLIWTRFHKGKMKNRSAAIEEYQNHIDEVKALVPENKLLIFHASDGWAPLCKFLNLDIPDEPFPRVNDKESMKKEIKNMVKGAYVILAGASLLLAGIVIMVFRALI